VSKQTTIEIVPENTTPLMRQYQEVKTKYPDAILLFRIGDFYETFGKDAILASKALGIVLTNRNNGSAETELAGFPYHSLDVYLPKLVKAGYRVAICEQLEKPVPGKVVRRGVTEVVTPGVTTDDKLLDQKKSNYLCTLAFDKDQLGIAFIDISTGEFLVTEGDWAYVDKLFHTFQPTEIVLSKRHYKELESRYQHQYYAFTLEDWVFTLDYGREKLFGHFEVRNLKGFGIDNMPLAQIAAGAALQYLATTENNNLKHLNSISRIQIDKYVWLDRFTIRNLELLQSNHENGIPLIAVLDKTLSPMGARLMKKWTALPLKSIPQIEARQDMTHYCIGQTEFREALEKEIRLIGDLERLISKVPLNKINPREVVQLKRALTAIVPIRELLFKTGNLQLQKIGEGLNPCTLLMESIEQQIVHEPPVNLSKGGVIADGFNEELDALRNIIHNSQSLLIELQQKESKATGITNLKIGYNNVFGYYLEVTNKYKDQFEIPENWVRKQTLTNAERYISEDLKRLEEKILGAEEKILALEDRLFTALVFGINDYIQPIQHNANLIGILDCIRSFAVTAIKNNYCRPVITEDYNIDIREGRHPVIEQHLPPGESYVANDVFLDNQKQQILMITGPNMAGKSALLRQTALICLMAQMGSFVPARSANIGVIDKVFTRVGASDNISLGESTFMVEMNETASIMNNISDRSLILLDEIGRGTSTYDGISIAWSIAEFLHENGQYRPKTLFATHYHELNELSLKYDRIRNFNVSVREAGNKVIFLRKLMAGGSHHSFGIYVAKMAGMPKSIVDRANEILLQLEQKHIEGKPTAKSIANTLQKMPDKPLQLSIFDAGDPNLKKLQEIIQRLDINTLTPIECMLKLQELKKMLES
jgi:DNA mismatch repair protein MutS